MTSFLSAEPRLRGHSHDEQAAYYTVGYKGFCGEWGVRIVLSKGRGGRVVIGSGYGSYIRAGNTDQTWL